MRELALIFLGLWLVLLFYAWGTDIEKEHGWRVTILDTALMALPLAVGLWAVATGVAMVLRG